MKDNTTSLYYRLAQALLALLCVVALICGALSLPNGLHINTDLKSLSPAIARDQVISQTLDQMSQLAASQIILVLTHPDSETLENANEALLEKIEDELDTVLYLDRSAVLDDYLTQLSDQPFFFLDETAQAALANHSDEQLFAAAMAKLYGSAGSLRLIPLQHDPMGYVSDYAEHAVMALSGQSDQTPQTARISGATQFYSAHTLKLVSHGLDMGAQTGVMRQLQQLEVELTQAYPGLNFLRSGLFFFAADAAQSSKADISFITTGSALGVMLLVLLLFRSIKALVLPLLSIVLGTLFAFIVCQALFGSLHIFTLVFGASLIGVVIDYSLHFFYFHVRTHRASAAQLYRALLLSLFTSVIGYSALSWSGLDALKQVALFSGLGLTFAWLIVVTLGPHLTRGVHIHDRWLTIAVGSALRTCACISNRNWLLALAAVASALLLGSSGHLPGNDSPRALFAANPLLIAEEQQVSALTTDHEPGSFLLIRGRSPQAVYDLIDQVHKQLSLQPGTLLGTHQFFPSPAQASASYAANHRLFGEAGLAIEFMRAQGFAETTINSLASRYAQDEPAWLSPASFFAQHADLVPPLWVEENGQISSFLLIPKNLNIAALATMAAEIDGVFFISAVAETTSALAELRRAALWLLLVALGLIILLMWLRFRTLTTSLSVVAVPALAIAGTLLCFAAFNVPMTLFHVMALFLVLGLGMDYVIFVAEMNENLVQTLSAIVLSATTSLLSFGLLSASELPAVSGFGLTVLIGNSFNLLGSLVLASRKVSPALSAP